MCTFCFLFPVFVLFFYVQRPCQFFFLNALVLYFYLEHVQRTTFCRCFLIFNPGVFCVDNGIILWLNIKNPATTTTFPAIYRFFIHLFVSLHCLFNVDLFCGYLLFLFLLFHSRPHHRQCFLETLFFSISVLSSPFNYSNFSSTYYL